MYSYIAPGVYIFKDDNFRGFMYQDGQLIELVQNDDKPIFVQAVLPKNWLCVSSDTCQTHNTFERKMDHIPEYCQAIENITKDLKLKSKKDHEALDGILRNIGSIRRTLKEVDENAHQ